MAVTSYLGTIKELQGLTSAAGGPFGRAEWFELLDAHGYPAVVAVACDGADKVALPLAWTGQRELRSLTNWYAFTWSILATTTGKDCQGLLKQIACSLSKHSSRIILDKLSLEDADHLAAAFRSARWIVQREQCDINHVLDLAGRPYAAYLAARPGPLRTTLKRKASKVTTEVMTRFDPGAWDDYEAVYRDSWKPVEGDSAFLRAFAQIEGIAGRLRLGIARHAGVVVAAQFWTVEVGVAYIHKLAHRQSADTLSAGTVLSAALFEHVIERDGVHRVDFGTGDDPYKRDWMEQVRPRYRLACWRPGQPRNWPAMGKALLRQLVSRPSRS